MPFVLDASMTMSWCFVDETTPYSHSLLNALAESYAEVPALWPLEVINVLAVAERKKRITELGAQEFLQTLAGLDIRVDPTSATINGEAILSLSRLYGLTAYDAAYLELAKRKGLPLATLDHDLIAAAAQYGVARMGQP